MTVSNKASLIYTEEFYRQEQLFKEKFDKLNGRGVQSRSTPTERNIYSASKKYSSNSPYFETLASSPKGYLYEYNTLSSAAQNTPGFLYLAPISYQDHDEKPFRGTNLIEHINAKLFSYHPRPPRGEALKQFMAPKIPQNISNEMLTRKLAREIGPVNKAKERMAIGDVQLFKQQGSRIALDSPSFQSSQVNQQDDILKADTRGARQNKLEAFLDTSKANSMLAGDIAKRFSGRV